MASFSFVIGTNPREVNSDMIYSVLKIGIFCNNRAPCCVLFKKGTSQYLVKLSQYFSTITYLIQGKIVCFQKERLVIIEYPFPTTMLKIFAIGITHCTMYMWQLNVVCMNLPRLPRKEQMRNVEQISEKWYASEVINHLSSVGSQTVQFVRGL